MSQLPSKIEPLGSGAILHCHFSVGFIVGKEGSSKETALKNLFLGLRDTVEDVKTGFIHYDFKLDYDSEEIIPVPKTRIDNGVAHISLYEEDDRFVAEVYIGNSIFNPKGATEEAKMDLYKDVKQQAIDLYECMKENKYVFEEQH